MKFTHLHVHSHYSLLDGLAKIDELVKRAADFGFDSLALTDHGVLYGAIEFYQKARSSGIQPIIGSELYVAYERLSDKRPGIDDKRSHLTVLAANHTGYQNLIQLVTTAHLEGFYYKPRVDKELLLRHREGLIALSGCLNGEIPKAILARKPERAEALIREYQEIFGKENFYLELGAHPAIPEQRIVNDALVGLAAKTGARLVGVNDVHYAKPEDREAQDILVSVQTASRYDDEERLSMKADDFSLKSTQEMADFFRELPEAIANTQEIAERVRLEIPLGRILLPPFPVPPGFTAETYLERLAHEGLAKRYGRDFATRTDPEATKIVERLAYELGVIEATGFASYFHIVGDMVRWAREHGILVGPGRGSAAGSLVAYLLGITNVDPLAYNLLFERFLNPERISMPDVDLDFSDHRRDEVIEYVASKYGRDRVAQIITFGTMAARAAIRDTGRALGMPYAFCDQLAKLVPFGMTLRETLDRVPEIRDLYHSRTDARRLIDQATKLEGVARHASTHACGVVIAPQPLTKYVPLQLATRSARHHSGSAVSGAGARGGKGAGENDKAVVTQYEMHAIEDLGLLKIDLLGLRNLSIIEDAVALVAANHAIALTIDAMPLDDRETFRLFREGRTNGIFQFECLSGDTIVSNTTIRKLHERGENQSLRSVYLDQGKIHNNRILAIQESGMKEVFLLITEDKRYIKASPEHQFMTANGWRKLEDIKPGDEVLIKTRGRHETWNTYEACGVHINGQREGKSRFCYSCSGRHYSNPSKLITRERLKAAPINFFTRGGTTWNKNLTKEQSEILRTNGRKISLALTGKTPEMRHGREKADQMRQRASERLRGSGNPMFGKPAPHRHGGYRGDLGHYVRSNWEADFARILKLHHVAYKYEPKTFSLTAGDGRVLSYTPDFYTPYDGTFYEIKGWFHEADQKKIQLFTQQYPRHRLILISATKFAELALQYKTLVRWECPVIPKGFSWAKVDEIRSAGMEMTYDIAMKAPANNFIANSFVVHNSGGMKRYLKELKPTTLEDLIAMVALYRPGPMELIPSFIARKHGREKIGYLHPKLEPILAPTFGIGVYQEQMMQIARDLAGFTLPEADTLRKAIGKKIKALLDQQKEKLIAGMRKNGLDAKTAAAIWELFPPFARYGFNRSHAACYALIAYQTAYLKAHWPAEFMAALMTREGFEVERVSFLVDEARSLGIAILPPSVNASNVTFTVVSPKEIRFGLNSVKNVGTNVVEAIIASREAGGPFASIDDFVERVQHKDLNKKSLESLIKCGALDEFGERGQLLSNLDRILDYARDVQRNHAAGQGSLFEAAGATPLAAFRLEPTPPASKKERLAWEKELLGLYVSEHPLEEYRARFDGKVVPVASLGEQPKDATVSIGGLVAGTKRIVTKAGSPMLFVQLEDLTGKTEVLVFPRLLEKNASPWQPDKILLVKGRLSRDRDEPKVLADEVIEVA